MSYLCSPNNEPNNTPSERQLAHYSGAPSIQFGNRGRRKWGFRALQKASTDIQVPNHSARDDILYEVLAQRSLSTPLLETQHVTLLSVDDSSSMEDSGAIAELNSSTQKLLEDLRLDIDCRTSLLLGMSHFGTKSPFELAVPFSAVDDIPPVNFAAHGDTPLCAHIMQGVETIIKAHEILRRQFNIDTHHGWHIVITDGGPTDEELISKARHAIREIAVQNRIETWLFGIGEGADMDFLHSIEQPGRPAELLDKKKNFAELFAWLKTSLSMVGQSLVGEELQIRTPNGNLVRSGGK